MQYVDPSKAFLFSLGLYVDPSKAFSFSLGFFLGFFWGGGGGGQLIPLRVLRHNKDASLALDLEERGRL